jgi:hypothetical protein
MQMQIEKIFSQFVFLRFDPDFFFWYESQKNFYRHRCPVIIFGRKIELCRLSCLHGCGWSGTGARRVARDRRFHIRSLDWGFDRVDVALDDQFART